MVVNYTQLKKKKKKKKKISFIYYAIFHFYDIPNPFLLHFHYLPFIVTKWVGTLIIIQKHDNIIYIYLGGFLYFFYFHVYVNYIYIYLHLSYSFQFLMKPLVDGPCLSKKPAVLIFSRSTILILVQWN